MRDLSSILSNTFLVVYYVVSMTIVCIMCIMSILSCPLLNHLLYYLLHIAYYVYYVVSNTYWYSIFKEPRCCK